VRRHMFPMKSENVTTRYHTFGGVHKAVQTRMMTALFYARPCTRMSTVMMALDLLIFTTSWAHVLLAPYTKVEESFNLHATHDVLMYGVGIDNLYNVRSQHSFRGILFGSRGQGIVRPLRVSWCGTADVGWECLACMACNPDPMVVVDLWIYSDEV